MGWLAHFFGWYPGGGNSGGYLFWSGAGSDIGELALIGSVVALVRTRKCEVHRCWRPGAHTTAAGHKTCRKHHPDGHLTAHDVHQAHHQAKETGGG